MTTKPEAPVSAQELKSSNLFHTFPISNQTCLDSLSFQDWWRVVVQERPEGWPKLALVDTSTVHGLEHQITDIHELGQAAGTHSPKSRSHALASLRRFADARRKPCVDTLLMVRIMDMMSVMLGYQEGSTFKNSLDMITRKRTRNGHNREVICIGLGTKSHGLDDKQWSHIDEMLSVEGVSTQLEYALQQVIFVTAAGTSQGRNRSETVLDDFCGQLTHTNLTEEDAWWFPLSMEHAIDASAATDSDSTNPSTVPQVQISKSGHKASVEVDDTHQNEQGDSDPSFDSSNRGSPLDSDPHPASDSTRPIPGQLQLQISEGTDVTDTQQLRHSLRDMAMPQHQPNPRSTNQLYPKNNSIPTDQFFTSPVPLGPRKGKIEEKHGGQEWT
ncbi:hypothetical protein EV421DRAFT_1743083 [Armillaria borealis]|uniref:Uncharacterized protein n=1 Tax=Armillaria borealis TaxID=47425 RepID=A0AA39IVY6_9AGAR|nr:hypothetical protein EV421DRAFT_1743083 [Armillaria borealis]